MSLLPSSQPSQPERSLNQQFPRIACAAERAAFKIQWLIENIFGRKNPVRDIAHAVIFQAQ